MTSNRFLYGLNITFIIVIFYFNQSQCYLFAQSQSIRIDQNSLKDKNGNSLNPGDKVFIGIHGFGEDGDTKDDAWKNDAQAGNYNKYISFGWKFPVESTIDQGTRSQAAADLLILLISLKYNNINFDLSAYSKGNRVLLDAYIIIHHFSELIENNHPVDPTFAKIWNCLPNHIKTILKTNKEIISNLKNTKIDHITTQGFAEPYTDPGIKILTNYTNKWINLVGLKDWVHLFNSARGNLDGGNLGDKPVGWLPYDQIENIVAPWNHFEYWNEFGLKVKGEIYTNDGLTQETMKEILTANDPSLNNNQISEELSTWLSTKIQPNPPPSNFVSKAGKELFCELFPIEFNNISIETLPIEEFLSAWENITVTISGTNEMSLNIEIVNNNNFPVSLIFEDKAYRFIPESINAQSMVIIGRTSTLEKKLFKQTSDQQSTYSGLIDVPANSVKILQMDAMCANAHIMGVPNVGYTDLTLNLNNEIDFLVQAKNSITWCVSEYGFLEILNMPFINKPTVWLATARNGGLQPDALQYAIWSLTDSLTYLGLTRNVDWNSQLLADQINLILETSAVRHEDNIFMPEWDTNWDSVVDSMDLTIVANSFNELVFIDYPNPDINRDGLVDIFDLVLVGQHYFSNYSKNLNKRIIYKSLTSFNHNPTLMYDTVFTQVPQDLFKPSIEIINNINAARLSSVFNNAVAEEASIGIQILEEQDSLYIAEIYVDHIKDVCGYQFNISYNRSVFKLMNSETGSFFNNAGSNIYYLTPHVEWSSLTDIAGVIFNQNGFSGKGVLSKIRFKRISYENNDFLNSVSLQNIKLSNSEARPISFYVLSNSMKSSDCYYEDDFDLYTSGLGLTAQSSNWNTWSGTANDDGIITNTTFFSPPNSALIEGQSDIMMQFGNKTKGEYGIKFKMFIEPGYGGYYNVLHLWDRQHSEWAFDVMFSKNGTGSIKAADTTKTFTFAPDTWFECENIINLDMDSAKLIIEGVVIHEWQWSLLPNSDKRGLNQLSAIDFYAAAPNGEKPKYYIDNVRFMQITPNSIIEGMSTAVPKRTYLWNNFPNPFNLSTTIRYDLEKQGHVKIEIFDIVGRKVETLINEFKGAGSYNVIWEVKNVSSGIYFYRMKAGKEVKIKKLVLIK